MSEIGDIQDRDALARYIARLIDDCERFSDEQKPAREAALEYYDGKVKDLTVEKGHSAAVSMDVRAVIRKMMPSIMRTLLSNDKIVEFSPVGPEDEAQAEQATDYMNHVVVPETHAERAIQDAIFDALTVKTGILKWTAFTRKQAKVHAYTNQPESTLLGLYGQPGVEILDLSLEPERDPEILALEPDAKRCSYKIRRVEETVDIRLQAIPRGSFLILPGYTIEDSPIVGDRELTTRSDLVSRGYDRALVASLPSEDGDDDDRDDGMARQGDDWSDIKSNPTRSMEQVLVYQIYFRLDADGDGIAELYKAAIATRGDDDDGTGQDTTGAESFGGDGGHVILELEPVDEVPYAEVVAEQEAHAFEGHSVAEDAMPIMKIKTALLREGLDNLYWQNKPQPAFDAGAFTEAGLDALFNPAFGRPIEMKKGRALNEALNWNHVPFFGDKSFQMMAYLDRELKNRTGVSDQSGGLDPETFQNMSATSANLLSEAGIAQVAMVIRSLSRGGIKKAFRGLLRLVIAHADRPRLLRLRKTDWVEYDPRHWHVDMDCTVNIGLGAGSRERDLTVLQLIYGLQKELLLHLGADNPIVKPGQVFNTLEKIVETAGLPSADPYFTPPDPQEVSRLLQQGSGPSEAETRAQTLMQIEQIKADARKQVEQAQMEADLAVRDAEMRGQASLEMLKAELQRDLKIMQEEIGLLKHRENLQLEREKAGLAVPSPGPFEEGDLIHGSV